MAVHVLQLLLHGAAEAAAVVAVQPLAHHAHAVESLVLVEGEVLDLGGDAVPSALLGPVAGEGGLTDVPTAG